MQVAQNYTFIQHPVMQVFVITKISHTADKTPPEGKRLSLPFPIAIILIFSALTSIQQAVNKINILSILAEMLIL